MRLVLVCLLLTGCAEGFFTQPIYDTPGLRPVAPAYRPADPVNVRCPGDLARFCQAV